jgi:hypothetical protein
VNLRRALFFLLAWSVPLFVRGESPAPASLVGEWTNQDFATGDNTRVHIRLEGERILVHMWGRCHPRECDWGATAATPLNASGGGLSLTWKQGFCVNTQELKLLPNGTLEISTHCHFTDTSGRKDYDTKSTFAKGVVHDWSDAGAK